MLEIKIYFKNKDLRFKLLHRPAHSAWRTNPIFPARQHYPRRGPGARQEGSAASRSGAPPLGSGTRNNRAKSEYVLENLPDIEYRTKACADKQAAVAEESRLLAAGEYIFSA